MARVAWANQHPTKTISQMNRNSSAPPTVFLTMTQNRPRWISFGFGRLRSSKLLGIFLLAWAIWHSYVIAAGPGFANPTSFTATALAGVVMDFLYDLFHVEEVDGKALGDALDKIHKLKPKERFGDVGDYTYRLSHLEKNQKADLWTGDIVKIRMSNLPGIGHAASDDIRDIPLQDYEGVTECASFAFSGPDDILVLQRNRLAIGDLKVCPLFREISGLDAPWRAAPIPRPDAVAKLDGASEIKNLVVKFARVKAPELIVSNKDGDKKTIRVAHQGIVPSLTVTFSNGRGKHAPKLDLKSMIALGKRAFGLATGESDDVAVDDVRVKGLDSAGDVLDLSLLEYQLSFRGVASKAKTRRIPYSSRKKFAEQAFEKCIQEARRIIKGQDDD